MATFRYSGRNAEGVKVAGIVDGNSAEAVASELLGLSGAEAARSYTEAQASTH